MTWKDIRLGEVSDAAVRSSRRVLHAEVQVEPVGQLDLEAHPDGVVPLLTGDVQDEPAAETREDGAQSQRVYVILSHWEEKETKTTGVKCHKCCCEHHCCCSRNNIEVFESVRTTLLSCSEFSSLFTIHFFKAIIYQWERTKKNSRSPNNTHPSFLHC